MAKTPKATSTPRFNLTVNTLRIAHEAIKLVEKPNAQAMFNCANAMAEIEAILATVPQEAPAPPAEEPAPAPKGKAKGKR